MRRFLPALLVTTLCWGAGQPVDPRILVWDQSDPGRVAGWEVVHGWDGAEQSATVAAPSIAIPARTTGVTYSARVRALPLDPGSDQPSDWALGVWTWPQAPPTIASLASVDRTLAPLPSSEPETVMASITALTGGGVDTGSGLVFTGPAVSGSNTYGLVFVSANVSQNITITATWGGVSMSELGTTGYGDYVTGRVFGLAAPSSGGEVSVSFTGTLYGRAAVALALDGVSGVRTATTLMDAAPRASTISNPVTNSAAGDLVVAGYLSDDLNVVDGFTSARIGSGGTFVAQQHCPNDEGAVSVGTWEGASGTITPSWSVGNTTYGTGVIALPVIPVSGASASLPRRALDGPFYGALRGSVR